MTRGDILYLLMSAKKKGDIVSNVFLVKEIRSSMLYVKRLQIPYTMPAWLPDEKLDRKSIKRGNLIIKNLILP